MSRKGRNIEKKTTSERKREERGKRGRSGFLVSILDLSLVPALMSCLECKLSSSSAFSEEGCEKMTDEEGGGGGKSPPPSVVSRTTARSSSSSTDFEVLSDTGSTPTPISYSSSGSRGPPSVCDEIKVEVEEEEEFDHHNHGVHNGDMSFNQRQQYPS